jgi:hypothetical protein
MIEVQQAIFGEGRDRGHALLGSSFSADTIPNQISGYTDLVDRPRDGELTQPVTRGLFAKEHFLLIRSFPDQSGRQGRVFSHALVLKKEDFLKIADISALLPYLLMEVDKTAQLSPIQFLNTAAGDLSQPNAVEYFATSGLVDHIRVENTIVWLNESAYWLWISKIWRQIPNSEKLKIRLGGAFNPTKVNTSLLNLLYLPEAAKNTWQRENFLIVEDTAKNDAPSLVDDYLLGKNGKQDDLTIILSELNPQITEIDDLRVIGSYANLYRNINKDQSIKDLLMLSGLIAHYNPAARSSTTGKQKILLAIAKAIPKAKAEDISYLQHQTWAGFDETDVQNHIGNALKAWFDKNLLTEDQNLEKAKLVVTALKARKNNWWHVFTIQYIDSLLKHWKSTYSKPWWTWVKTDLDAAIILFSRLPDQAEQDLIDNIPTLDKPSKDAFIRLSAEKKWFNLYGVIAIAHYPSKEAFAKVIALVDPTATAPLFEKMATKIPDQRLVTDAALLNNSILNDLAARKILGSPALKKTIQLDNNGWQQIWLLSVTKGVPLWSGIDKPKDKIFAILDLLIKGGQFDPHLLSEISAGQNNSLKDYPQRKTIWGVLVDKAKIEFLSATLADCLSEINAGRLRLDDLEKPLRDSFESPTMLQKIISEPNLTLTVKLELFSAITKFGEAEAELLTRTNRFSSQEAKILGNLILTRRWKGMASSIFSTRRSRSDLDHALRQCYSLLNFWERLNLSASGFGTDIVSRNESWDMLLQKVIDHYPDGPNQNGIWENAGGKRSDLHTSGSSKQIWTSAIAHMKNGGHPKPKKLLKKMIEEFPYDESLKQLNELL